MDQIVEGVRWSLPTGVRWSPVRAGGVADATVSSDGRMSSIVGTAVLLVEQLIEKALVASDRVYALAQGRVVLEAQAGEPDLARRLERAYFGQDVPTALHA